MVVGQAFAGTSQYGRTDYGTSELESIARMNADEPVGANVCVGSAEGFSLYSRTEIQPGFGTGRTQATLPGHCWKVVLLGIRLPLLIRINKSLDFVPIR